MTRTMDPRGVFRRFLDGQIPPTELEEVDLADSFVGEALSLMSMEEPSLAEWLQDDHAIGRLLQVSTATMWALLKSDMNRGVHPVETAKALDTLIYMAMSSVALHAVIRDRELRDEY